VDEEAVVLTPLPAEDWDDEARASLSSLVEPENRNPAAAGNALATMVRHPSLTEVYLPFNTYLLQGSTLPPRIRELLILRVAHYRCCTYEWGHHLVLAREVGLSDDELAAVQNGTLTDEFDRTLMAAVDELHQQSKISPETWAALGVRLDDQARMDLIFTVGGYGVFATALNTFGVQLEPAEPTTDLKPTAPPTWK
jgi:4-carboxymuconolactone decarboxylase